MTDSERKEIVERFVGRDWLWLGDMDQGHIYDVLIAELRRLLAMEAKARELGDSHSPQNCHPADHFYANGRRHAARDILAAGDSDE